MKIFLLILLTLCGYASEAQWMRIYANGGCVMMLDSSNTVGSCDKVFRFKTNQTLSTVTISTDNRIFSNYKYTQIKKEDGTLLASSFSDLLTKLGEIQASTSSTSGGGSSTTTPANVSYSCMPITSQTVYAAGAYKEISVSPLNYGTYTLQTGSNTANTGLTNTATLRNEVGGLISNTTTITPTGGSTLTVCTKQ